MLIFMFLAIFLFVSCKITEESHYAVTVTFEDGSFLYSSGKELDDYIEGHCATAAWKLFCQKYPSYKTDSNSDCDSFRFQCWGEGVFEVDYKSHKITVASVIG